MDEKKKLWWLNEESQQVLNRGYLLKGETTEGAIERIVSSASKKLGRDDLKEPFRELIENGWMSLSSPIWSNMGTERGLPISCFSVFVPDSIEGVTHKLGETIMQTKIGGGTSGYFGEMRGRGSAITDNGESSGAVSFMKLYDTAMDVVSQGSCFEEGTEILTDKGFKDFRDVVEGRDSIYQVDDNGNGDFTSVFESVSKPYTGDMHHFKGFGTTPYNVKVTANHRMVYSTFKNGRWSPPNKIIRADELPLDIDTKIPLSTVIESKPNQKEKMNQEEILRTVLFALKTSSSVWEEEGKIFLPNMYMEGAASFVLDCIKQLGIKYQISKSKTLEGITLEVDWDMDISWINLNEVSLTWIAEFMEIFSDWGCLEEVEGFQDLTATNIVNNEVDLNKFQSLLVMSGAVGCIQKNHSYNSSELFLMYESSILTSEIVREIEHVENKNVYCVIVPKGRIIVRYKGHVTVISNTRRGSFAAYLDIDHPDINEFLRIKDIGSPIQNLFTGVCVPDYWMQDMISGDEEKRNIWAKVIESRQQKGLPYIFFSDNVNKNKPQVYKDKGRVIHGSNLCVSPTTEITIRDEQGTVKQREIKAFEDKEVEIWNGEQFSKVTVKKTGTKQQMFKVLVMYRVFNELGIPSNYEFETLDCTEYHKWYDLNSNELRTKDLQLDQQLEEWVNPDGHKVRDISVVSIKKLDDLSDTYCFTEPLRGKGVFNNILTGQCSEILLNTEEDESFVCCLSSMNLELYDEWKDTNAVELATYFLDAVLTEFIEKTENDYYLTNSRNFAVRQRAIGLGVLGWHSYLQKNLIPFGSLRARFETTTIFKQLQTQTLEASKKLAIEYGEPELLKGYGIRNATTMAIAPTTSSSAILGQTSPGIEPFASNYYKAGLAKGNFMRKNKYLVKILEERGHNTEAVWREIMLNHGSVQGLSSDILTDEEKEVFKTFREISQYDIIMQASLRQKYIDQGQSLNLNIPPGVPVKDVNNLLITGWKEGIKCFYYQRSSSVSKDLITNIVSCSSCES